MENPFISRCMSEIGAKWCLENYTSHKYSWVQKLGFTRWYFHTCLVNSSLPGSVKNKSKNWFHPSSFWCFRTPPKQISSKILFQLSKHYTPQKTHVFIKIHPKSAVDLMSKQPIHPFRSNGASSSLVETPQGHALSEAQEDGGHHRRL